jgi:hypothetical protein
VRFAARTDGNKKEVVAALEAVGCTVYDLKMPVDLMVWSPSMHQIILIELKDGAKSPSRRRHTSAQARFIEEWPGKVYTCKDIDEALQAVGAKR